METPPTPRPMAALANHLPPSPHPYPIEQFVHVKRVPEAAALYPAVLSRPSVVAAVVVVYTLALVTSLGVDPDEVNSSGGAPSSSGREVGLNAEGKWQLIKADEEGGGN